MSARRHVRRAEVRDDGSARPLGNHGGLGNLERAGSFSNATGPVRRLDSAGRLPLMKHGLAVRTDHGQPSGRDTGSAADSERRIRKQFPEQEVQFADLARGGRFTGGDLEQLLAHCGRIRRGHKSEQTDTRRVGRTRESHESGVNAVNRGAGHQSDRQADTRLRFACGLFRQSLVRQARAPGLR